MKFFKCAAKINFVKSYVPELDRCHAYKTVYFCNKKYKKTKKPIKV